LKVDELAKLGLDARQNFKQRIEISFVTLFILPEEVLLCRRSFGDVSCRRMFRYVWLGRFSSLIE
jgi:hypothetical protein